MYSHPADNGALARRSAPVTLRKGLKCGVLVAVSVLAVAVPSAAIAAPAVPGAEPVVVTAPAGEYCAFPIQLSFRDGTRFHDEGGAVFSTGPLSVTATNLNTGASQTFNASGPTFRDGSLTGPALIGQPQSSNVGDPFLIINRGRATFTANNTIATITGNQIDVCASLS